MAGPLRCIEWRTRTVAKDWVSSSPTFPFFAPLRLCEKTEFPAAVRYNGPMRLLIYSINYAPEPTSTGKYAGEMAAWLAKRGHDVHVVAPLPHYPQWRVYDSYRKVGRFGFFTERLEGVTVHRTPIYVPPRTYGIGAIQRAMYETSFSVAASFRFLKFLLSRHRFDAIIPICPPAQLGMLPYLMDKIRRVPWVFHVQDLQVDAAIRLDMMDDNWLTRFIHNVEGSLLRRASAVSTITEAMRQRIIERGVPEQRAWLSPNWANLDEVTPGDRDNTFRHDIGLNSAHLLFMYAGNMGVKQGLEVVLDAAAILKEDPRVRFALIGGGAARMALQEKLGEMQLPNVQMHPVQPKEKLNDMLAAADVHLIVQRREAADLVMPSKLTNIVAAGRPSIATADAETTLAQVLLQNKCGLVAKPDKARSLATAVRHLARDPDMRKRFGYNARQYAEKELRQDFILEDFERRLTNLVTGGGKPRSPRAEPSTPPKRIEPVATPDPPTETRVKSRRPKVGAR